ncbi:hypothetical protein AB0D30_40450 [Streptomyces sp. NPDC048409]|uniref:hypothetical protein n=1 Tax=unclassified Streptomyces TaxID=2593676 RepID=UPI00343F9938
MQHHTSHASTQGSVVLDIGEDTAALIIHTAPEHEGVEIHVSPVDRPEQRTHAAVRSRLLADRTIHCVLISSLPAGTYTVWKSDGTPHGTARLIGGTVAEYHW